jgi:rSAM/selenodomain-associated transferase 1
MARAPRLGAVKRRLARDVGDLAAWRFYRHTLAAQLRRLGGDRRWQCWLAVTPDRAVHAPWPAEWRTVAQGRGDLGSRMARVFRNLPPGPVVMVGSDSPGLRPAHIARAFACLGGDDWVFGPAGDGGYWLIGARRRPAPIGAAGRSPFAGVRWSSRHALADTLANLAMARVAMIEDLPDIDTGADLAAWRVNRPSGAP